LISFVLGIFKWTAGINGLETTDVKNLRKKKIDFSLLKFFRFFFPDI